MTWGSGGYGGSPWGLGGPGDLYVVSVLLTSERTVVVELSKEPRAVSSVADGDALNPNTWYVQTLDGLGNVDGSLLVLSVKLYSGTRFFELYTLDKFSSYLITHRVGSNTMVDPGGALIVAPKYGDFLGCVAQVQSLANRGLVDVANPQLGREEVGGTLIVGSDGDYANESGVALYRKLVIRRLLTTPGDWFHYDPSYGVGVRLKEPFVTNDLTKLKVDIENQLKLEPEFSAVQVTVSLAANGVMIVTAQVQIAKTNEKLSIPIQVPTSLAQL